MPPHVGHDAAPARSEHLAPDEQAGHGAHADHTGHEHHALPTGGRELTSVAVSATLHCLTGCAIGEVSGMAIGTALGWSDWGTIALAVGLAFLFGSCRADRHRILTYPLPVSMVRT